jgi:hypothetical protein
MSETFPQENIVGEPLIFDHRRSIDPFGGKAILALEALLYASSMV